MKNACVALVILVSLAGCSKSVKVATAPPPIPTETTREYIDLEPGWRLRIVAPVTKSGSTDVGVLTEQRQGNVITLKTSADLIGFETAFWSIIARPGGGISIRLASAELTVEGKPSPIEKPTRALVHVPHSARYVRAFYLTRKSDADHNMALAGAARIEQLEAFTRAFHESPNEACADYARQRHYCEWIPAGMAVRPEAPKIVNGITQWPKQ